MVKNTISPLSVAKSTVKPLGLNGCLCTGYHQIYNSWSSSGSGLYGNPGIEWLDLI